MYRTVSRIQGESRFDKLSGLNGRPVIPVTWWVRFSQDNRTD